MVNYCRTAPNIDSGEYIEEAITFEMEIGSDADEMFSQVSPNQNTDEENVFFLHL